MPQGINTINNSCTQGHNEVRWRPGQEASLAPPMFETEVCRKLMYCIEGSTCDIVGTFQRPHSHSASPAVLWHPHSDSAPGELRPPCPPPLRPCMWKYVFTMR